jgi:flagellar export protein FliJ
LKTLVRLRREELDERRQLVAQLENRLNTLVHTRAELEKKHASEKILAEESTEALFSYPAFAAWMKSELQRVEEARVAIESQADAARDGLREAFTELKKLEIAERERIQRERKVVERREQQVLDDVGLSGYLRKG